MNFIFSQTAKLSLCCSFLLVFASSHAQVKWEYYMKDAITQKPIVNLEIRDYNGVSTHTDENGYFKLESSSVGIQFSDLGYFLDCPNCVPNKDTSGLNAQVWFLIPTEYYTLKAVQIGQNENVRGEMLSSSSSLVLLGSEGRFSFDGSSLQSAFNSIPGVQYDSRGYGGSSRISFRGSFLRSPFAVRNLKMYLNGIALTNPDGQSPLEMFDLSYLGQMEVTKGPAGALFGSGHGGVVQMQLPALARNHLMLEAGSSVGEFGYRKGFIAASGTHGKLSYGVHVNSQTTDGYRQQEWNFRENILGNLNWNGKSNQKLIFIHYRGAWGLPGALNATQVVENPLQAVPFAISNNTSVNKWRDMIAYTLDKKWGSQSIQFSANAYTSEKLNPYGTSAANSGYKNENAFGGGFRGIYGKSWKLKGEIELLSQVGSECQFEYLDFYENSSVNGTSGDLKIAFESYALNWNVFEQLSLKKGSVWSIHTSLGTNATPTVSKGTNFIADPPFQDLDSKVNYELKLYPRIGASLQLNEHLFVSGNWTKGNSAPSIFEQLDYNTNSINKLASEYSSSSEIGIKSTWKFFQAGVALYNQEITNAIVVADTVIDGLPRSFVNSNGTVQRGMEWQVNYLYQNSHLLLNLWNNGSWNVFEFATASQGSRLPGVPLCQINSGLSGEWEFQHYAAKLGFKLVHQWTDKTPLNNANSEWANARQLLNLDCYLHLPFYKTTSDKSSLSSVEVKRTLGSIGIHAGINNVTNTTYTSFYQVNGFGGKFFNPMPLRNYYAGLVIRFMM